MMVEDRLCLLWQNVVSRQWYHIGSLFYTSNHTFIFTYENNKISRGLSEALQNGYVLHPTFKDRYHTYESNHLFAAFSRRLPNRNRKDYSELMDYLDISEEAGDFDVLAASGGKLIADHYEFVRPISIEGNKFAIECFVRGWRHYVADKQIHIRESEFSLVSEPSNEQDPKAVAVYKGLEKVGYIPAFYSDFFYEHLKDNNSYVIEQFEYNQSEKSQYKLKIKVSGKVNSGTLDKYHDTLLTAL